MKSSDNIVKIIDAVTNLVDILINSFGRETVIAFAIIILMTSIAWRWYSDKRKDKYIDQLLEEKDKTIQRLAKSERAYRALFFKEKAGWTEKEINNFILKNNSNNIPESRKALEGNEEDD